MILKILSIRRRYDSDEYETTVEYSSNHGDVRLNLTQAQTAGILDVVAESIVSASRDVASSLTAAALSAGNLLEVDDE